MAQNEVQTVTQTQDQPAEQNPTEPHNSYFQMEQMRYQNLVPFPKWTTVMEHFEQQQTRAGGKCENESATIHDFSCSAKEWKKFTKSLRTKPMAEQLSAVNDWGNTHPYVTDIVNWGVDDYWETPYEFIEINGDCEDYAIAKYYSLRAAGIPAEKLRVMIVQDLNLGGIIHAVLGVYDNDEHLIILDNQSQQVIPALNIYHYRPIYGLNENSWWAYYPTNG